MGDGFDGALTLASRASFGAVFGTFDHHMIFKHLKDFIGTKTYTYFTLSAFFAIDYWVPSQAHLLPPIIILLYNKTII